MGRIQLSEQTFSRRLFLKLAGGAAAVVGALAIAGPVISFFFPRQLEEVPSEPMSAGALADLPVGEAVTVRYGRYPALVIHTPDGLRAYSAVCTHFACLVKWDAETGEIMCPCHEGFFNVDDGSVISGPPPRPLDAFPVTVQADGQIMIGGEEEHA